jgi:hypothetical protein
MAYMVHVTFDKERNGMPKLTEHDSVRIDFGSDANIRGVGWPGKVMAPTMASNIDTITMKATRPIHDGEIVDLDSRSPITYDVLDKMAAADARAWCRAQKTRVKFYTKSTGKEAKRIANNIDLLRVPKKELGNDTAKEAKLQEVTRLLTCNDHTLYTCSSLYQDLEQTPLLHQCKEWIHVPIMAVFMLHAQKIRWATCN